MVQHLLHLFRKLIDATCSHVKNLILKQGNINIVVWERER